MGAVSGGDGTSTLGSVKVLPGTPCSDFARCMNADWGVGKFFVGDPLTF